jgi:GTP-binding protein
MALPIVAIVGRPNVGKSSLLNLLTRRQISIVDPTAGVTRDRVSAIVEYEDHYFEIVDTGGHGIEDHDDLTEHVEGQISLALDKADLILFVVDITQGITPLDRQVAQLLRQKDCSVLLVANKADSPKFDPQAGEFFKLGFGEPFAISAQHGRNRAELLDAILDRCPESKTPRPEEAVMKFAVVGKQNVGKSTFINSIAGEDRVIVSEVAGTTRDSVDVRFEKDGKFFVAIDTAGVRKKKRIVSQDIEYFSYTRALRSIRRADVVFLFLDATSPTSQVDKKLTRYIVDQFKPCIIVINKWDLAKDQADSEDYHDYINKTLPGLSFAPICFITASEGKNVQSLLDLAAQLHKQATSTVPTARLNKLIETITDQRTPSVRSKVGMPKIYYATQVSTQPPTLMIFVNHPNKFDENYQRFLLNRFRDDLPYPEVPIRMVLRHHHQDNTTNPDRKRAGFSRPPHP